MVATLASSRALRIAMLAPGELFGGAERQILYLLAYLQSRGVECHLICFHDRDFAARVRALGIRTLVLPAKPVLRWQNARRIAELVRERQLDVVHVHGYKAAAHAWLARRLVTFRVVKTEHGGVELGRGALADLKPKLFRAVENWCARRLRAHLVYVTRDLEAKCATEHAGFASTVIPNGIDFAATAGLARPPELDSHSWNLVIVGRLEPVKGVESAIRALAEPVVPAHVRLWVIGEGPLRDELQALTAKLGLEARVRFLGFRTDAMAFIAHAQALVMPSLHEGLPYTLLESVAARVPVIASRVGGLAETLEHERTALLTPVADVAAVAQAIARLATEPTLATLLAARAYESLRERYSIEAMGDAYLRSYADAATGQRR